jgi:hypothetical protein
MLIDCDYDKVRILSKKDTLEGLKEYIDEREIPEYYGGGLKYPAEPGKDPLDAARYPQESLKFHP